MSSTYSSFIPQYGETSILDSIASMAEQLGQQQFGWAQQQFQNNSALTDQVVNNFLSASNKDMALADNMTNRYTGEFQPQEDALVKDANTYGSNARVRSEMGRAESDVGQSMDAAKQNAERQLQSFGIDPSSGRYAELDRAEDSKRAAAAAQSGQAARYNTEAVGRDLRNRAIAVGQQYPGQIVNSLNNAMQGFSGAENAKLSNTNTGVNAFNSSNDFLKTGMALKFPPLGTAGSHGSILNTTSNSGQSGGGGPRSGGSGGGFGGGGGGLNGSGSGMSNYRPFGGDDGSGSSNASYRGPMQQGPGTIARIIDTGWQDQGDDFGYGSGDPYGGGGNNALGDWGTGDTGSASGGDTGMGGDFGYGYSGDAYGGSSSGGDFGSWGGDASASGASNDDTGDWGYGYSGDAYGGSGTSDYGSWGGDAGSYDDSSFYGSGGDMGDYASGGAIPDGSPTTGGFVPPQASPTGGSQTDDVNAHVNVGEFIIPRDVALWKGQEFFQKLIEQSRQKRQGAPAKGKPSNRPTNGPPSFVSQQAAG